ncbi:MAG: hypothetical protein OHK0024_07780 [Thalassobaculales bacterium]
MSTSNPPPFNPALRRPMELPGAQPARRPGADRAPPRPVSDSKRLLVGREIVLNGEITACDTLEVEGQIEANLSNSHTIIIAESGSFRGTAEIVEADINGLFQGSLTVRGRLYIRGAGKVSGTVRYGQLEIELGGELSGDIQILPAERPAAEEPAAAVEEPAPVADTPAAVPAPADAVTA